MVLSMPVMFISIVLQKDTNEKQHQREKIVILEPGKWTRQNFKASPSPSPNPCLKLRTIPLISVEQASQELA